MPKKLAPAPKPELSQALTVTTPQWDLSHTAANYRIATDVAGLCKEIVVKSASTIAGKKYIRAEGWQAIAIAHGCVASARDVERIEGGIRCIGEVRKVSDGIVISTAEGFVGDDETTWQKRPEYAKRAMAQTRAISRACRSAFAHVVVMMDAGLSTTPSEEIPDGGFDDKDTGITKFEQDRSDRAEAVAAQQATEHTQTPTNASKPALSVKTAEPQQEAQESVRNTDADLGVENGWQDHVIHFGKNKGIRLGDLEPQQLRWYQKEWKPRPFNEKIQPADKALRDALDESLGKAVQFTDKDEAREEFEQAALATSREGNPEPNEDEVYLTGTNAPVAAPDKPWQSHQIACLSAKKFKDRRIDDLEIDELEALLDNWILKLADKIKLSEAKKREASFVLDSLEFNGYSKEKIAEARKLIGS